MASQEAMDALNKLLRDTNQGPQMKYPLKKPIDECQPTTIRNTMELLRGGFLSVLKTVVKDPADRANVLTTFLET